MAPFTGNALTWIREALSWSTLALLMGLVPVAILGRVELSASMGFGMRSYAHTAALVGAAAVLIGAPRMRWPGSYLLVPLLALAAAAALSVTWNHGARGDVRNLTTAVALFFTVRGLLGGGMPRRTLLTCLGLFVAGLVVREILIRPEALLLRESARNDFVTMHPNTLGFVLALLGPVFLAETLARVRAGESPGAMPVWLLFALVGILPTYSRSGWLALAIGCGVVIVGSRDAAGRRRAVVAALLALVLVASMVVGLSLERHEADFRRLRIMATSLSLFREHWLFGIGLGISNLEKLFPARYEALFGEQVFLFHSHNQLVDLLVGTGVVGTAAALWLTMRLVAVARGASARALDEPARIRALASVAVVAVLCALSLVDTPLYHPHVMLVASVLVASIESPP